MSGEYIAWVIDRGEPTVGRTYRLGEAAERLAIAEQRLRAGTAPDMDRVKLMFSIIYRPNNPFFADRDIKNMVEEARVGGIDYFAQTHAALEERIGGMIIAISPIHGGYDTGSEPYQFPPGFEPEEPQEES